MRFNIAFFAALLIIIVSILSIPNAVAVILTAALVLIIIASLGKDIPFIRPFFESSSVIGTQSGEPTFVEQSPATPASQPQA